MSWASRKIFLVSIVLDVFDLTFFLTSTLINSGGAEAVADPIMTNYYVKTTITVVYMRFRFVLPNFRPCIFLSMPLGMDSLVVVMDVVVG